MTKKEMSESGVVVAAVFFQNVSFNSQQVVSVRGR